MVVLELSLSSKHLCSSQRKSDTVASTYLLITPLVPPIVFVHGHRWELCWSANSDRDTYIGHWNMDVERFNVVILFLACSTAISIGKRFFHV